MSTEIEIETPVEAAEGDYCGTVVLPELLDPLDGQIINTASVDELAEAFERLQDHERKIKSYRYALISAIASHAPQSDGSRTVRVRGDNRRIKLELPSDSWNQSILKRAWSDNPKLASEVLRIDRLAIKAREWDIWQREAGTPEFEAFKQTLASANQGPRGLPRVTLEDR